MEEYRRLNQKLADNYKGKIADILPADFYEALQIEEQSSIIGSKLGVYAYLNMVTQMKNTEALAFYQNIDEKMTEYSKPSIFSLWKLISFPNRSLPNWQQMKSGLL